MVRAWILFGIDVPVLALTSAKLYAATTGLGMQVRQGGAVMKALQKSGCNGERELLRLVYRSNVIDARLYSDELLDEAQADGYFSSTGVRGATIASFRAPVTISIAAVTELLGVALHAYGNNLGSLPAVCALAVALVAAASATMHLLTAITRRLIFGVYDAVALDVQLRGRGVSKDWAVQSEKRGNLPVYFLGLVYIAIAGFAALYAGLASTTTGAFDSTSVTTSALTWIYFSVETVSTVGFGDIHPRSAVGQIAVMWQIAVGPLLLSWLLAVLVTPGEPLKDADGP